MEDNVSVISGLNDDPSILQILTLNEARHHAASYLRPDWRSNILECCKLLRTKGGEWYSKNVFRLITHGFAQLIGLKRMSPCILQNHALNALDVGTPSDVFTSIKQPCTLRALSSIARNFGFLVNARPTASLTC